MTSLFYFFRPSSRRGNAKGRICIRLIHRRKSKIIATAYRIYRREWDPEGQTVLSALPHIAGHIRRERELLENIIAMLEEGGSYDVSDVVAHFRNRTSSENLLSFVEEIAAEIEQQGQERTADAYRTATRELLKYTRNKNLPLKQIDSALIKGFEKELKATGKSMNTISFYMRNLRAVYNRAIEAKRVIAQNVFPFKGVFMGVQRTQKRALNLEEIQALMKLDASALRKKDKGLWSALQLFFFCFHARGMCFVDMAFLRKENIRGGRIIYYRKKTGRRLEVKITPILRQLIDSFESEMRGTPYVCPVIRKADKPERLQYESALRVQNERLKRLAQLAGLKKKLSTHVARHSWATTAKSENIPLWVISEGLGHNSEKTTYTYLASFENPVIDNANDVIAQAVARGGTQT
jgi:integrase